IHVGIRTTAFARVGVQVRPPSDNRIRGVIRGTGQVDVEARAGSSGRRVAEAPHYLGLGISLLVTDSSWRRTVTRRQLDFEKWETVGRCRRWTGALPSVQARWDPQ